MREKNNSQSLFHLCLIYLFLSGKNQELKRRNLCAALHHSLKHFFLEEKALRRLVKCLNPDWSVCCDASSLWFSVSSKTVFDKDKHETKQPNWKCSQSLVLSWSVCLLCILRITGLLKLAAVRRVESDTWGRMQAAPARHRAWWINKSKEVRIATQVSVHPHPGHLFAKSCAQLQRHS